LVDQLAGSGVPFVGDCFLSFLLEERQHPVHAFLLTMLGQRGVSASRELHCDEVVAQLPAQGVEARADGGIAHIAHT
jgi:hypothetical protein